MQVALLIAQASTLELGRSCRGGWGGRWGGWDVGQSNCLVPLLDIGHQLIPVNHADAVLLCQCQFRLREVRSSDKDALPQVAAALPGARFTRRSDAWSYASVALRGVCTGLSGSLIMYPVDGAVIEMPAAAVIAGGRLGIRVARPLPAHAATTQCRGETTEPHVGWSVGQSSIGVPIGPETGAAQPDRAPLLPSAVRPSTCPV